MKTRYVIVVYANGTLNGSEAIASSLFHTMGEAEEWLEKIARVGSIYEIKTIYVK